jgi:hypothetical protein
MPRCTLMQAMMWDGHAINLLLCVVMARALWAVGVLRFPTISSWLWESKLVRPSTIGLHNKGVDVTNLFCKKTTMHQGRQSVFCKVCGYERTCPYTSLQAYRSPLTEGSIVVMVVLCVAATNPNKYLLISCKGKIYIAFVSYLFMLRTVCYPL